MSSSQTEEDLLQEVALIYFLCYETNNSSTVDAFIENRSIKIEEWNNLPLEEKQQWISQSSVWLNLYKSKYPHHYNRILNGWKKIYNL